MPVSCNWSRISSVFCIVRKCKDIINFVGEGLQNLDECSASRGTTNARRLRALLSSRRHGIFAIVLRTYSSTSMQSFLMTSKMYWRLISGTYHPSKKIVPNTKNLFWSFNQISLYMIDKIIFIYILSILHGVWRNRTFSPVYFYTLQNDFTLGQTFIGPI